ncbi:radical SAM protein [Nocardia takedensis]
MAISASDWQSILQAAERPDMGQPEMLSAIATLTAKRVLVSTDENEFDRFFKVFEGKRRHPKRLYPLVAVTSQCNIACTYCYEDGIDAVSMQLPVVDACLRWFERRIIHDELAGLHPGLFGGEPLMRPSTLFALMDGVNSLGQRYGIETSFYTSSNGLLLTNKLARSLARRGLSQIQISLDGTDKIHDQRRHGHKQQPTFVRTLDAIRLAVEYIPHVTVKINFDRHNIDNIPDLFDLLVTEQLSDRVNVKLEAIALQLASSTCHDATLPIPPESTELADSYTALMVEARARNITVSHDTAHTTPCMFSAEHAVLIGPTGEIFKCISLVGRSDYSVGSVFDDDYDRQAYDGQMDVYKRTEQCVSEECPYLPVCAGGCAYESIVREGSYELRFCTKEYLTEFHFKRHLFRRSKSLENLGMHPLSADELRPVRSSGRVIHSAEGFPAAPSVFFPISSLTMPEKS